MEENALNQQPEEKVLPQNEEMNGKQEQVENIVPRTPQKEEEHHHHHHHHHHSSKGKKKKKSKKFQAFWKKIEPYVTVTMLLLLTFAVTVVVCWSVSANNQIDVLYQHVEALTKQVTELQNTPSQGNATQETDTTVPKYVEDEVDEVAAQIRTVQNGNTVSFLAITDMHLNSQNPASVTALDHAGQAMAMLREQVGVDFAVNLGDITYGDSTTTVQTGIEEIKTANRLIAKAFQDIPNFRTPGNHDPLLYSYAQNGDYLDAGELYGLIGSYNQNAVFQEEEKERGYCYRDFEDAKLRVISLNTSDVKDLTGITTEFLDGEQFNTVSDAQLQWLVKTLDLSAKTDAGSWQILLLSHIPLNYESNANVAAILDAYTFGQAGVLEGTEISYDFQNINTAKIIANVHGHLHNHRTGTVGAAKIPTISIPNASVDRSRGNDYPDGFGDQVIYEKVADTAEETAFCVVTIDLLQRHIYVTAYGAGYSRQLAY